MRKVSIFGMGYVGVALGIAFGQQKIQSYCIDVDTQKVDMLSRGVSPIKEGDFDILLKKIVEEKYLTATISVEKAVMNSDISFICVGTPSDNEGNVDLGYIQKVIEQISEFVKKKNEFHLFVIRSTVPPGTTKEMARYIEHLTGKKNGKDFGICMNPEFLREGSSLQDFFEGKYNIIGADNEVAADYLHDFYKTVGLKNIHIVDTNSAEIFKYINNWFHALKIAFTNEVGRICGEYDADAQKLMSIFVTDDRLNISPYYLRPGFAFGGYCLPKDVRAVQALAKMKNVSLPVADHIIKSNNDHITLAAEKIIALKPKKVGMAGLVFKVGTDDFRESAYLELFSELNSRTLEKFAFDKHLHSKDLIGRNKAFIDGFFAATRVKQLDSMQKLVDTCDLVVGGSLNKQDMEQLYELVKQNNKILFDLNGTLKDKKGEENYISFM